MVLGLVPGLLAFNARPAVAQRPTKGPARIGWLSYLASPDPAVDRRREGMRELGHVESTSYVLVTRYADADFTRLPTLIDELVAEKVDVLGTRGPSADYTTAVRSRVPIVVAYSGDPVESGFAQSLARPGLNMTGITFMALELPAKRVEVLKALVPSATRVALLSNPEHAGELAEYRVPCSRIRSRWCGGRRAQSSRRRQRSRPCTAGRTSWSPAVYGADRAGEPHRAHHQQGGVARGGAHDPRPPVVRADQVIE